MDYRKYEKDLNKKEHNWNRQINGISKPLNNNIKKKTNLKFKNFIFSVKKFPQRIKAQNIVINIERKKKFQF